MREAIILLLATLVHSESNGVLVDTRPVPVSILDIFEEVEPAYIAEGMDFSLCGSRHKDNAVLGPEESGLDEVDLTTSGVGPAMKKRSVQKETLTRRSALDKNFMRFGKRSQPFFPSSDPSLGRFRNMVRFTRDGGSNGGASGNFMRFGRGKSDNFMRFGRGKNDNFMRFGRRSGDSFLRFGKAGDNFMRFGRGGDNFMRFGKAAGDNFMRFGKAAGDNFMRFGRGSSDNFMRFGKATGDNFMRFGKASGDNFMRFGKASGDNFMRFGKASGDNFMRFGKATGDNFMRFGKADGDNFMRFGKAADGGSNFIRFGRRTDGTEESEEEKVARIEEDLNKSENQGSVLVRAARDNREPIPKEEGQEVTEEVDGGDLDLSAEKLKQGPVLRSKRDLEEPGPVPI